METDKQERVMTYGVSIVSDVTADELVTFLQKKGIDVDYVPTIVGPTAATLIFKDKVYEDIK